MTEINSEIVSNNFDLRGAFFFIMTNLSFLFLSLLGMGFPKDQQSGPEL